MVSDELGEQLHDRATRGEILSPTELTQLQAWYDARDRVESVQLNLATPTASTVALQTQLHSALGQMATITKQIQEIVAENDALRNEITALRRQLANRTSPQPA